MRTTFASNIFLFSFCGVNTVNNGCQGRHLSAGGCKSPGEEVNKAL